MIKQILSFCLISIWGILPLQAQTTGVNYDENKIPPYTLPALLESCNGRKITSVEEWERIRRPELLSLFADRMFGKTPVGDIAVSYKKLDDNHSAIKGSATRKQIEITFSRSGLEHKVILLMYLPNQVKTPVAIFLSPNFKGNQTVCADPDILPTSGEERGVSQSRWPIEKIIDAGYGIATVYYFDFFPDRKDGLSESILPLFGKNADNDLMPNDGQAISTWAWGLSRIMDYLETDRQVDASKVILMGHSRLGKTALWAGAQDERFAIVISNCSGCGGAALSRRTFGETVEIINQAFPHWFCKDFRQYGNNEASLPFDQHELIALIAPRPVYVASAEEDKWADPKGEFLSAYYAGEAYKLYEMQGIETSLMPATGSPIMNRVGYHIRPGIHDVTDYDWGNYIKFADKWLK